ncbi:DUF3558 domain-containing protein [Nocardia sp. NPDC059177]|uniref:DUF3558 domain-containing protein n=1 Tax=Nocardia sp. NPDC059177 TaxID=3346759 RepID=UPI0036CA4C1C
MVVRRSAVVASVVCGVLAVAGCSTAEEGNAQPSSTTDMAAATAALWDPCSEIPESTLTGLGLDVSSKRSGILGVEEPGWRTCRWEDAEYPPNYGVGAYTTIHTIDELRAKPTNVDVEDVTIAGQVGLQYRQTHNDADEECSFAFPTSYGLAQIDLLNISTKSKSVPPCERLKPIAEAIIPLFPK